MLTPQKKDATSTALASQVGGDSPCLVGFGASFSPGASTPLSLRSGSSVEFFSPGSSPNASAGSAAVVTSDDVPLTPATPASAVGCDDLELHDQFGFGDSSVLHASMLEHNADLDLSGFANATTSPPGVPQSWLTPELPKRIKGLFAGFGNGFDDGDGGDAGGSPMRDTQSPTTRREGDIRESRSLPGSPTLSPRSKAANSMPFFASELSKRVLGLFPGFGKEEEEELVGGGRHVVAGGDVALKRSPQSHSLRNLNADIRRNDIILTPPQPAAKSRIVAGTGEGGAGVDAGAGRGRFGTDSATGKAIPTFGSELSRRVQGLFNGFESSPFRRADQKSVKLQRLDAEIKGRVKASMFASCPDLTALGGSSTDVLDGVDLEELKGFSAQMRYLGKVTVPEEMNSSEEESFDRINAAKDHLRAQNGNCTVNMTVSATHVNFESLSDGALALWFSRTLNDIVRIDRTDETWVTITFTPEVKLEDGDEFDGNGDFSSEGGFGDEEDGDEEQEQEEEQDAEGREGHIVQVFVLPTEEEAMDLCAALTEHLGDSNNLFV